MSIFNAMYNGVTGLNAQSRSLNAISQNIANVNTVGYKGSRTSFETLVGGWTSGGTVSGGVRAATQSLISQQGVLQASDSSTDIAIDGEGFFVVAGDATGGDPSNIMFTRAGSFTRDANNNLVNAAGQYLTGWRLDANGNYIGTPDPTSTSDLDIINLNGLGYAAQPTSSIGLEANISSSMAVGNTYNSSVQVFDSLGGEHTLALGFEKIGKANVSGMLDEAAPPTSPVLNIANPDGETTSLTLNFANTGSGAWTLTPAVAGGTVTSGALSLAFDGTGALTGDAVREITVDWGDGTTSRVAVDLTGLTAGSGGSLSAAVDANSTYRMTVGSTNTADSVTTGAAGYVSFDSLGRLVSPASRSIGIDWADGSSVAADSVITLKFGTPGQTDGLASQAADSAVRNISQDGLAFGAFSGVTIDKSGKVIAQFDNGQTRAIYQIPIAQFANPDGLEILSGNAYQQTLTSGSFYLSASGSSGAGSINSNFLEGSTVDLAGEFSNMIITQRAYSANATIITTADEMLQELGRIKR